jgi:hypothetical protein
MGLGSVLAVHAFFESPVIFFHQAPRGTLNAVPRSLSKDCKNHCRGEMGLGSVLAVHAFFESPVIFFHQAPRGTLNAVPRSLSKDCKKHDKFNVLVAA